MNITRVFYDIFAYYQIKDGGLKLGVVVLGERHEILSDKLGGFRRADDD